MANPNQKPATAEQWDEAQIEQALKRLKGLHIQASYYSAIHGNDALVLTPVSQMRNLRSTIPRMMEPMAIPSSSRT